MDIKSNQIFWDATINEVENGFIENDIEYQCLICESKFQKGRIYKINGELYDAKKASEFHIEQEHGSVPKIFVRNEFQFYRDIRCSKRIFNIDVSKLSDKEVSEKLGVAQSH